MIMRIVCPLTALMQSIEKGLVGAPPKSSAKRRRFDQVAYQGLPTLLNKLDFKKGCVVSNELGRRKGFSEIEKIAYIKYGNILKKCPHKPAIRKNGLVWDILLIETTRVSKYGQQETVAGVSKLDGVMPYWKL